MSRLVGYSNYEINDFYKAADDLSQKIWYAQDSISPEFNASATLAVRMIQILLDERVNTYQQGLTDGANNLRVELGLPTSNTST
jgi:hypothetical protein